LGLTFHQAEESVLLDESQRQLGVAAFGQPLDQDGREALRRIGPGLCNDVARRGTVVARGPLRCRALPSPQPRRWTEQDQRAASGGHAAAQTQLTLVEAIGIADAAFEQLLAHV